MIQSSPSRRGRGAQVADVAAALGFGDGQRRELEVAGAAEALRRPLEHLLRRGGLPDRRQRERGHHDGEADARATPEQLLHEHRQRQPGRVADQVAVEQRTVEAPLGGLLEHRPRELLARVVVGGDRADHLLGELVGAPGQVVLRDGGGEVEAHAGHPSVYMCSLIPTRAVANTSGGLASRGEARRPASSPARRGVLRTHRRGGGRGVARPRLPRQVRGPALVGRRAGPGARGGESALAAGARHDAVGHGAGRSAGARAAIGVRYGWRLARPGDATSPTCRRAVRAGWPVADADRQRDPAALGAGRRLSTARSCDCYEPSSGEVRRVPTAAVASARLDVLGFPRAFAFVLPLDAFSLET